MKQILPNQENSLLPAEIREQRQSLWRLVVSPSIWLAHFLACYITGAIWCEKFARRDGGLEWVRLAIATYTVAALIGIGLNARAGWRRHKFGDSTLPHDFDTPEDRTRFLGFSTFLLAALSAVATVFTAIVAFFFSDCR